MYNLLLNIYFKYESLLPRPACHWQSVTIGWMSDIVPPYFILGIFKSYARLAYAFYSTLTDAHLYFGLMLTSLMLACISVLLPPIFYFGNYALGKNGLA